MLAVNQTHLDSNRILYQWIFRFRSRKVYPQFFKTLHSLPPIQTFIFIRSLLCWPIASLTLRCLFTWGSRMHFLWCSEALFPFLSLPTLHQIGELWHLRGILVSQASDFFFFALLFSYRRTQMASVFANFPTALLLNRAQTLQGRTRTAVFSTVSSLQGKPDRWSIKLNWSIELL